MALHCFWVLMLVGFGLHNNADLYISVGPVLLQLREIAFLLLPVVNYLGKVPQRLSEPRDRIVKLIARWILVVVFLTEVMKCVYYGFSLMDLLRSLRMGLPLFSMVGLLAVGLRLSPARVWSCVVVTISISVLSQVADVLGFDVFSGFFIVPDGRAGVDGRFYNSNSSFGVIGAALIQFRNTNLCSRGFVAQVGAFLSLVALLGSFNRTIIISLCLVSGWFALTKFRFKRLISFIVSIVVAIGLLSLVSSVFVSVKSQVSHRFGVLLEGTSAVSEAVYYGGRDVIVSGVTLRISQGYWLFGVPVDEVIFEDELMQGGIGVRARETDTSFINILLRYGIIPLSLVLWLLVCLYRNNRSLCFRSAFICYLVASLNLDTLVTQNSIFFVGALYLCSLDVDKRYPLFGKNRLSA